MDLSSLIGREPRPCWKYRAGHTVIVRAFDRARSESEAYLFNHAVRSWLFAARIAQLKSIAHDGEVLAVGVLLHDLTLTKEFKRSKTLRSRGCRHRASIRA
jgi:HD superfamily phosphodiesterase